MAKFFTELVKIIFKIILTILWAATQLAEFILKHINEFLKSIVTKH